MAETLTSLFSRASLWPRWLFLRALGLIFFSVFLSLALEIHGLLGTHGILPAREVHARSIFSIIGAGDRGLTWFLVLGFAASALIVFNRAPRVGIAAATILFGSFLVVARDFASYQSDGMLMEAGAYAFCLAPRGWRPRLGADDPPPRAAGLLLVFLWLRIYFESGIAKIWSHDPQWAHLTAMDHYYQNGPLPTLYGWIAEVILPHAAHAVTSALVLLVEIFGVWVVCFGRAARRVVFIGATLFQIGIIVTANYAFLNYLVLSLGVLLVDDDWLRWFGFRAAPQTRAPGLFRPFVELPFLIVLFVAQIAIGISPYTKHVPRWTRWLDDHRLANRYALFASMTDERIELEVQVSDDGERWTPLRFRFKPQGLSDPPKTFAPLQPRFDWNLWFASLGPWQYSTWVIRLEKRVLDGEPEVLALFDRAPRRAWPFVRVEAYRYTFESLGGAWRTGRVWEREDLGLWGPSLRREGDRTIATWGDRDGSLPRDLQ